MTVGWFVTGNHETAAGPYDRWAAQARLHKQAIAGAWC